jgi:tetratricopeptide (TPR) repeat protein
MQYPPCCRIYPHLFLAFFLSLILSGCGHWPRFIILKDPLTVEEHLTLGTVYESKGEFELAVKEYQSALAKDKDNGQALFFLGNAHFHLGNLEQAEVSYQKALTVKDVEQKGLINNNLAWVYVKKGEKLDQAEKLCKEAIRLDSINSSLYLDTLGVVYFSQKKYALAEEALLAAIEMIHTQNPDLREEILHHLSEVRRVQEKK